MSDHVFAETFPVAEAKIIASAVMTKSFSAANIRDAWVLAEFGMCQIVPGERRLSASENPDVAFKALAEYAEGFEKIPEGNFGVIPNFQVDWAAIIRTILTLILGVL